MVWVIIETAWGQAPKYHHCPYCHGAQQDNLSQEKLSLQGLIICFSQKAVIYLLRPFWPIIITLFVMVLKESNRAGHPNSGDLTGEGALAYVPQLRGAFSLPRAQATTTKRSPAAHSLSHVRQLWLWFQPDPSWMTASYFKNSKNHKNFFWRHLCALIKDSSWRAIRTKPVTFYLEDKMFQFAT